MRQQLPKPSAKLFKILVLFCLVSGLPAIVCCSSASAISSGDLSASPTVSVGGTPGWLEYNLSPGQTTTGTIRITNHSDAVQMVELYPVDAVVTDNGGFGLLPKESQRSGVGAWLKLSASQLTLPADASRLVGYSFSVPANAPVGKSGGGIVLQPLTIKTNQDGDDTVNIVTRLGIRVYETVPGLQKANLSITSFKASKDARQVSLAAELKNTGNTSLTPNGYFMVKNLLGHTVNQQDFSSSGLLEPNQSVAIKLTFPVNLVPDHYTSKVVVDYGGLKPLSEKTTLWVNTRTLFVIVGVQIVVISLIWITLRRDRRVKF